eukprot:261758-Chlamydomonas_euryale.AAC.2
MHVPRAAAAASRCPGGPRPRTCGGVGCGTAGGDNEWAGDHACASRGRSSVSLPRRSSPSHLQG